ncbi:hypothetical protein [Sphingomonas psychrotolerans]|uniref:Uncharacterized protein n=1 Tax=Sphingomonas psychrotolerans TaxID=1327635 RepID=A0A2K8MIL2_9SPHN|nr:hypothetical protein [Sphingomonas psychrotolerans]ATY31021.1 hypothetical protein CVN68_02660 [Sphingomonas psychrotolerans]
MSLSFFLAMMLIQRATPGVTATENLAGDRIVPLVSHSGSSGQYCTADARWCLSLIEAQKEDGQVLPAVRPGNAAAPTPTPPAEEAYSNETHSLWPGLILLKNGGFLAGVETRTSTAYSGGGGSATELRLFRVSADGQAAAKPVLIVPIGASLLIRACFGENDMKKRRGACHDEYSFSASLGLAREAAAGLPIFSYVTTAHAFPRGVSRLEDSTAKSRLRKSDLVQERDPECSFSRKFRFDVAAGAYQPESQLPDCSAYTVP